MKRKPDNMRKYAVSFFLFLSFLAIFLGGCQEMEEKDPTYNFIGDSHITRWPLDQSFPSQLVYNYGQSGSGIDYLQPMAGRFNGQRVVVITGTNDYPKFYEENLDSYVSNYLQTISQLSNNNVYLFSVFPRDMKGDPSDINSYISLFNNKVKERLGEYPNIKYIDVYDEFMDGDHINYQYYSDGLHLSSYGYEILTSKLLDTI